MIYPELVEEENIAVDQTVLVLWIQETVTMTMTVQESPYVGLTTAQYSLEEDGILLMIVVREDVPQNIPAERERVTVSMTLTVSTLAGQDVVMICVSTPSISQLLSIQIIQTGLDSVPMTIAATGFVTKTTTDVEIMLLDVNTMKTVLMDITVTLMWFNQHAGS